MAGTKLGGIKARNTNLEKFGENFYGQIGKIGGSTPTSKAKGFAANHELARIAGAKGGRISRRRKKDDTDRRS